ncbi:MAG: hypothetical protein AAF679_08450, partial [Pseudomonadota bacterium]
MIKHGLAALALSLALVACDTTTAPTVKTDEAAFGTWRTSCSYRGDTASFCSLSLSFAQGAASIDVVFPFTANSNLSSIDVSKGTLNGGIYQMVSLADDKVFLVISGTRSQLYPKNHYKFSAKPDSVWAKFARFSYKIWGEDGNSTITLPGASDNIKALFRGLLRDQDAGLIYNNDRFALPSAGFAQALSHINGQLGANAVDVAALTSGRFPVTNTAPPAPAASRPQSSAGQTPSATAGPTSTAGCTFAQLEAEANRLTAPARVQEATPSASFKKLWLIMNDLRALHVEQNRRCPGPRRGRSAVP